MKLKSPAVLLTAFLAAFAARPAEITGKVNQTNAYPYWERRYAYLGNTTEEILSHARSEHPHSILSALDFRIRQKSDLRGERSLSGTEKQLHIVYWVDVELNNLEFKGYFLSKTANDAEAALDAFKKIGATNAVAVLQRAMAVFPGGRPPRDALKRREVVEQIAAQAKSLWENCVADYYFDNRRLHDLALAYAKKNSAEIVLP